jgi:FdhD protein
MGRASDRPASPAVRGAAVVRLRSGAEGPPPTQDEIAVEAPLEVRFSGRAATVLMRTPGDDEELVSGFLLSEGLVTGPRDVVRISRPSGLSGAEVGNVVDVELYPSPDRRDLDRPLYSSSSCGTCGKRSLASLEVPAPPVASTLRVSRAFLGALPARMREAQATFRRTGGVHACALFDGRGELVVLREDVGRHNAVDKVVGWAMAHGRLPLSDGVLQVSGRIGYELAQKAVVAGAPILSAVGAPSSMAVDVAEAHGLTLVGFVRPDALNVYTHPERVTG